MRSKPIKMSGLAGCFVISLFCLCDESSAREFEEMVVTGVMMESPLSLETDPKASRQPLPAQDGAEYLKTLPGFSVIRKGGAGGDPVFRGMAGSRLSILMDGSSVLGGCDSRMDPPTAYVFPETYDRIRLIKGPQTVLYGPGNSAGVVLFERDRQWLDVPGWMFYGSLLTGGFGRDNEVLDVQGGTPDFYLRGAAGHSQQDNYQDGDGNEVHSSYDHWNAGLAFDWTPNEDVVVEFSGGRSDAEAAFADRAMDGAGFMREHFGLKLIMENPAPGWRKLEAQIYSNYVDHVMDNFSLRDPEDMMPMASDRDRLTRSARVVATFDLSGSTELAIGIDGQTNDHTVRETLDQTIMPYQGMPRMEDARFRQLGIFGEWTRRLTGHRRVIAGLRMDEWRVEDRREMIAIGVGHGMVMPDMMPAANPTAGEVREETLSSGFLRYERDLQAQAATFYAGLGRSERFPDYWELIGKESLNSVSAFGAEPEITTQLDTGIIYRKRRFSGSVSLFYNQIDDYLLIQSGVQKPMDMMGVRNATVTRNVDATSWGVETAFVYAFTDHWHMQAALATVRGDNETDGTPLAQMPPLELRLGLNYESARWSAGVFWRGVDGQTRVDIGKGNIAGQDIGSSDGFNVVSVNAGWRIGDNLSVTAGIDNLFDETYAEHISRAGAMIEGFEQTTRVNEPGRNAWVKARWSFE